MIKTLVLKIILKIYEKILRLRSRSAYHSEDFTQFLIDHFTEDQKKAEHALKTQDYKGTLPVDRDLVIFIPFKDKWETTEKCLRSIFKQTYAHFNIRVVAINHASCEEKTLEGMRNFSKETKKHSISLSFLKVEGPFNFSRFNNIAVKERANNKTEWLLFLNNDVELIKNSTLQELVETYIQLPQVGALGCTLLYPNKKIQHLFVAPGVKIAAAHPLRGEKYNPRYKWFEAPRPVAAVTGASLLISIQKFNAIGGFEEKLPTHGQDIDLCLKLQKSGYINWTHSRVLMYHHESFSRVHKPINIEEIQQLYQKWEYFLKKNSFYSLSLSRWSEFPVLKWVEGWEYPWGQVLTSHD